jgi:uncharacterized protein YjbI with pentapeptide repeats
VGKPRRSARPSSPAGGIARATGRWRAIAARDGEETSAGIVRWGVAGSGKRSKGIRGWLRRQHDDLVRDGLIGLVLAGVGVAAAFWIAHQQDQLAQDLEAASEQLALRLETDNQTQENLRFVRQVVIDNAVQKPFDGLRLSRAPLRGVDLACDKPRSPSCANFSRADLSHADLSYAKLAGADLSEADLRGAVLNYADLPHANLSVAVLTDAALADADLTRADLSGTTLERASLVGADLAGANMSFARLTGADLGDADLRRANLNRANLTDAFLLSANLTRADLTEAYLDGTVLEDADLTDADLTGADLGLADLRGEGGLLRDTNLTGVCYDDTTTWPDGFTPPAPPDC